MRILLAIGTSICALVAMAVAAGGVVMLSQYAPVIGISAGLIVSVFALISFAAAVYLIVARRHHAVVDALATLLAILPSALILAGSLFVGGLPTGVNGIFWVGLVLLIGTISAIGLGLMRMRAHRAHRQAAVDPADTPMMSDAERPRIHVAHQAPPRPRLQSGDGRRAERAG